MVRRGAAHAVERGAELGDAVVTVGGGECLVESVELTDNPSGARFGSDPDGLYPDAGGHGHVAGAGVGAGSTGEVHASVSPVRGRKSGNDAVESGSGLHVLPERCEGAGTGRTDVRLVARTAARR
ncbi:hypothetical protein ACWCQ0_51185 [Streptomyces massasporeus]